MSLIPLSYVRLRETLDGVEPLNTTALSGLPPAPGKPQVWLLLLDREARVIHVKHLESKWTGVTPLENVRHYITARVGDGRVYFSPVSGYGVGLDVPPHPPPVPLTEEAKNEMVQRYTAEMNSVWERIRNRVMGLQCAIEEPSPAALEAFEGTIAQNAYPPPFVSFADQLQLSPAARVEMVQKLKAEIGSEVERFRDRAAELLFAPELGDREPEPPHPPPPASNVRHLPADVPDPSPPTPPQPPTKRDRARKGGG